jgi:predicted phage tail protein
LEKRMIRTVHLHGYLGTKYGELHRFNLNTPAESVRALQANYPDFCPSIRDREFHVVTGDLGTARSSLTAPELQMGFSETEIHIVPRIAGGKFDFMEIILGIALIGLAFALPALGVPLGTGLLGGTTVFGVDVFGSLLMPGVLLMLGGILGLITPVTQQKASAPSFLFNGALNTTVQGGPVPVVYGTFGVGSVLISAGVKNENIPISPSTGDIMVPGLTGMYENQANEALQAVGLELGTVTSQFEPFYPAGLVISQWPDAGSYISQGDSVNVVISTQTPSGSSALVPTLKGLNEVEAAAALNDVGLNLGTVTYGVFQGIPPGFVISQDPKAGIYVPMGSSVNIVLSKA